MVVSATIFPVRIACATTLATDKIKFVTCFLLDGNALLPLQQDISEPLTIKGNYDEQKDWQGIHNASRNIRQC